MHLLHYFLFEDVRRWGEGDFLVSSRVIFNPPRARPQHLGPEPASEVPEIEKAAQDPNQES